jgi:beta-glucuronidase
VIRPLLIALAALAAALPVASAQAAAVPPEKALYQQGPSGRYLLNGGDWLIRRDPSDVGEKRRFFASASRRGWSKVTVPNAWNAEDNGNASMGGSVTWYRKDFRAPAASRAATWLFHFDNVRYRGAVWLNGKPLGRHAGAYLPWEVRAKAFRRSGVNRLVVRVDSRNRATDLPPARLTAEGAPNGGWWNYGGILGDVYLRRVDGLDFSRVAVRPALPCATCAATVSYGVTVRNYSHRRQRVSVTSKFGDADVKLGTRTIKPGGSGAFAAKLEVAQPRVWSPPDPQLYDVTLSARAGGGGASAGYQLLSGIRSIAVKGGRLLLNGAPVHFRGVWMHEDQPKLGAAVTHAREELFVRLAKQIGATVIRTHYPFTPYMHELADRNGLMIWSEIPVYQVPRRVLAEKSVNRLAARMLTDNIRANGNHPSVMAWSIANELASRPDVVEQRYFRNQSRLAKKLDPTRPVALAVAGYTSIGCQRYKPIDILGINSYYGWYQGKDGELADREGLSAGLDYLHRCYPKQALVVTEFGAEGNRSGPVDEKGTYEFQADLYDYHLGVYATKPWLAGALGTFMTFKCRPGWEGGNPRPAPPFVFHDKGVFDWFGRPKPAADVLTRRYHEIKQYGR